MQPKLVTSVCHHFETVKSGRFCEFGHEYPPGCVCTVCDLYIVDGNGGFIPPCAPHQHYEKLP